MSAVGTRPVPDGEALARETPEWQRWLSVYGIVRRALGESPWATADSIAIAHAPPASGQDEGQDYPLLVGAVITVDATRVTALLRGLFAAAGLPVVRLTPERSLALLTAAVAEDAARIEVLAPGIGAPAATLSAVAALATVPLLHGCRRALAAQVPPSWAHGHCPVCGAWPTLAEARGVERTRHFRCGRCGSGWYAGWLRCPYCGNGDHRCSGSLVPDETASRQRVETCEACHGYVKTLTVLLATPAEELALADLCSVALDVVAIEHGYRRPPALGRMASARVVAALLPGSPR
jgi:hypothetical protein